MVPWRKLRVELSNGGQVGHPLIYQPIVSEPCTEYAQDHAELGASLNGFSLNESDGLSGAIEKTGQAVDTTYMSTTKLVSYFELSD